MLAPRFISTWLTFPSPDDMLVCVYFSHSVAGVTNVGVCVVKVVRLVLLSIVAVGGVPR